MNVMAAITNANGGSATWAEIEVPVDFQPTAGLKPREKVR